MRKHKLWRVLGVLFVIFSLCYSLRFISLMRSSSLIGMTFTACISLLFLGIYLKRGWRHWIWLFVVCLFGSLGARYFLAYLGITGWINLAPLFTGLGFPFLVGFLINPRKNWWALLPASMAAAFELTIIRLLVWRDLSLSQFVLAAFVLSFITWMVLHLLSTPKKVNYKSGGINVTTAGVD